MRAFTTLFLTCGFPGVASELEMDSEFLNGYLSAVSLEPRTATNDLRRMVGAPTLVVKLTTDEGVPIGTLRWRFTRVRWEDFVGNDQSVQLVQWYSKAVERTRIALPLGWQAQLMAPPPQTYARIQGAPHTGKQPKCTAAPPEWFDGPWIDDILGNNCYNYAVNIAAESNGPAIPGKGTASLIGNTPSVADLKRGCKADKLKLLGALPSSCPSATGHIVAVILRASNFGGFHCFRLNRDKMWSHKDGPDSATDMDDAGNQISKLDTAEFGFVFDFAGFFQCPSNNRVD
jgi:hypothetical protein